MNNKKQGDSAEKHINPNVESLYLIEGYVVALRYLIHNIYEGDEDASKYGFNCGFTEQTVANLKESLFAKLVRYPNAVFKMLGCVDILESFIEKLQYDDSESEDYKETYADAINILDDLDCLIGGLYE